MCEGREPSFEAVRSNWSRSDLPLFQKILVAARNNVLKVKHRANCCGNFGEPGC